MNLSVAQRSFGNTSTDVEKTSQEKVHVRLFRKHLHGRGEDQVPMQGRLQQTETPPRTWRRRRRRRLHRGCRGNTSTDVEKTSSSIFLPSLSWKHLHGRGEDGAGVWAATLSAETPPRTWRRLAEVCDLPLMAGNTSTDVEKTEPHQNSDSFCRKHLHGRGEDGFARSRWYSSIRNTSTDVEKTRRIESICNAAEKHLHGRGEDQPGGVFNRDR